MYGDPPENGPFASRLTQSLEVIGNLREEGGERRNGCAPPQFQFLDSPLRNHGVPLILGQRLKVVFTVTGIEKLIGWVIDL